MRSRLAHAFWNVDPEILLSTVTEDFPNLRALLSTIEVHAKPISDYETVEFTLKTERLLALPDVVPGSGPSPGARIVVLVFGHNGRVGTIRVGHRGWIACWDPSSRVVPIAMGLSLVQRIGPVDPRKPTFATGC